jgi:hypothetical protein
MDIRGVIESLVTSGQLSDVVNDPMAQFGQPGFELLGATLLPNRTVEQNAYREEDIRYRTVIANDGTRYSPVQKKRGILAGWMDVRLGNQDIGDDFTSSDYDAFLRLINAANNGAGGNPEMTAMLQLLNWTEQTLNRPLEHKIEKMRWEAIVDAQVTMTGDNNYREVVGYPNPTGHRVNTTVDWSDDAADPYLDITTGVQFLAAKGYTVSRMIGATPVLATLQNNDKIKQRAGRISVAAGTVVGLPGRVNRQELNGIFAEDNIPGFETYDRQYRTQTGSGYFLKQNALVLVATTGRDETIDRGDQEPLVVRNTIGYVGVGRAAGQSNPGRRVLLTSFENKPPRIEGEAWQTTLPVIRDPEAFYVIQNINTAYD